MKQRRGPVTKSTIRRQVPEYRKATHRHAQVRASVPTAEEQRLSDRGSGYLQRETLHALQASQRQLVTLILRKLLATSTYAIAGTIDGMAKRLQQAVAAAEAVTTPPENLPDDWEPLDELVDEWAEDDDAAAPIAGAPLTPGQLGELKREMADLREFHALARSIVKNSKGEVLLTALRRGFAAAADAQGAKSGAALQQKAVIFTESRRTQTYLFELLELTGFA